MIFLGGGPEAAVHSGLELAGRYRLEAPLARGGMGEVWRGVDLRLRRPVAVKILLLTIAAEEVGVARFRREAEIAATLNHPGVTTVFDIGEHQYGEQHLLFLVMELMQGRDLAAVLAGHPGGMPVEQVLDVATQILDALSVAHEQGVVHRDIKPANLFLVAGGRVKICDFGIARLADATKITATGSSTGTPLYMAPEQIQGREVDQRTDLYALGCVLYELLTGTTWVDTGSGVGAILYQHLNQTPAPPKSLRPQIPDHLDTLVLDLLAKQPDDRPQDAASVAERLRPFPDEPHPAPGSRSSPEVTGPPDSPPADRTPPLRVQPSASGRIRRRTVLLGGLGTVALVGVPTALLLNTESGRPNTRPRPRPTHTGTLTGHTAPVASVAFSPDGKTLATAGSDKTARLWDVATGRNIATLTGHADGVDSVAFSPDGKVLVTGNSDSTARLWDVATRSRTTTLAGHGGRVDSVAFSADGKTVATGGRDQNARLWNVATGNNTITLTGHAGGVTSVAFSPDGKVLATGSSDKTVRLCDLTTGRNIATLTGHAGGVTSVAFSPDGKTLATGSRDFTARLWRIK